jgi:NAD(P)-dependent dehydrogenase (short-subunit alcohol dehydrogenase family)
VLDGKVAVVTGGASGIGRAVVERLRADGAHVYAADISLEDSPDTLHMDVTDERSVEAALDRVVAQHGRLDICVANAGISPTLTSVAELDLAVWERVIAVNLTGAFLTLRGAARRMLAAGNGGRLLATSSVGGLRGGAGGAAYCATKFGLRGLIESLAVEVSPTITANLVAPGDTATPLLEQVIGLLAEDDAAVEPVRAAMTRGRLAGRLADPAEIAGAFAYLASDEAAYVTGTVFAINGGALLGTAPATAD